MISTVVMGFAAALASLVLTWSAAAVRWWLLAGRAAHTAMRVWSAFDLIPKALAFEKADRDDEPDAGNRL